MSIAFRDIPAAPEAAFLKRTRPPLPSRRLMLKSVAGAATAVAFGALETVNAAVAKAAYFQEYTNIHAGPWAKRSARKLSLHSRCHAMRAECVAAK